MRFPIVTITLADVSPQVAAQSIHYQSVSPNPPHLFIQILAEIGDVQNAAPIVQVRINQVFPQASEHGYCDLSLVRVHEHAPLRTAFVARVQYFFHAH
jgi:hypothetical protein